MISTIDVSKPVREDQFQEFTVPAACLNMLLQEPHGDSAFIEMVPPAVASISADLKNLLQSLAFQTSPSRIRQFAVWTLTDNPRRTGYSGIKWLNRNPDLHRTYVPVQECIPQSGSPTEDELEAIRALLRQTGIDTRMYRAFGAA
jgi:hypothetical protein